MGGHNPPLGTGVAIDPLLLLFPFFRREPGAGGICMREYGCKKEVDRKQKTIEKPHLLGAARAPLLLPELERLLPFPPPPPLGDSTECRFPPPPPPVPLLPMPRLLSMNSLAERVGIPLRRPVGPKPPLLFSFVLKLPALLLCVGIDV